MSKKWGSCDFKQLQRLRNNLAKLEETDLDKFSRDVSRELAARLLKLVIHRTPVGEYDKASGKKGGTLRRGWTARTAQEAESRGGSSDAKEYAMALPVTKVGDQYQVEVINPVEYASWVEFGHTTKKRTGWAPGQYFLTLSEADLRNWAPAYLEKEIDRLLKNVFKT